MATSSTSPRVASTRTSPSVIVAALERWKIGTSRRAREECQADWSENHPKASEQRTITVDECEARDECPAGEQKRAERSQYAYVGIGEVTIEHGENGNESGGDERCRRS